MVSLSSDRKIILLTFDVEDWAQEEYLLHFLYASMEN